MKDFMKICPLNLKFYFVIREVRILINIFNSLKAQAKRDNLRLPNLNRAILSSVKIIFLLNVIYKLCLLTDVQLLNHIHTIKKYLGPNDLMAFLNLKLRSLFSSSLRSGMGMFEARSSERPKFCCL